jgi:hypothetical protein
MQPQSRIFFSPLSLPQDLIDLKQAVFARKDKE